MAEMALDLSELSEYLKGLAKRDEAALKRAVHRTLAVDAHRWIQWSIRGGVAPSLPSRRRRPKKPRARRDGGAKKAPSTPSGKRPKKPRTKKTKSKQPEAPALPAGYRPPIDTGDYAGSWRHTLTDTGGHFYSAASPPIKAGVIEAGRRPAPIPVAPLSQWVKRKLGVTDPAEARSIAFAISKKASKVRRPGLRVLGRAVPKIQESLSRNVTLEFEKGKG